MSVSPENDVSLPSDVVGRLDNVFNVVICRLRPTLDNDYEYLEAAQYAIDYQSGDERLRIANWRTKDISDIFRASQPDNPLSTIGTSDFDDREGILRKIYCQDMLGCLYSITDLSDAEVSTPVQCFEIYEDAIRMIAEDSEADEAYFLEVQPGDDEYMNVVGRILARCAISSYEQFSVLTVDRIVGE